jgi:MFS family permease
MSLREDLIYIPALLMDMGTASVTLGVTFFASSFGASPLVIGVTASVYRLLYVFFCQVFGRLSDRVSRKRLTQIACLSFSVLHFLIPFCKTLYQLVILFPLSGVILAALWPALEGWIGERRDGRSLVKRVSVFNLFWTGGLMIGYLGGGYIGYVGGVQARALFYFASIAALCATAMLAIQPRPVSKEQRAGGKEQETIAQEQDIPDRQLANRFLYLSWVANSVSYLTLSIIRYILPKYIYHQVNELGITLRMAPLLSGLLMLCQAGAQFVMFFILGTTERWRYRYKLLVISQIFASFGFLLIWFSGSPWLWAPGLMIIGLNVGITYSSSIYYSLYGSSDPGGKSGWHESILHSGTVIGPSIGGALASYAGLKSPYLFCAVAVIAGLPIQNFILRRRNPQ